MAPNCMIAIWALIHGSVVLLYISTDLAVGRSPTQGVCLRNNSKWMYAVGLNLWKLNKQNLQAPKYF
jgi:hypothetical protein